METNDTKQQSLILKISGKVEPFVSINPKTVRISGKIGEELESSVTVAPAGAQKFNITGHTLQNGENLTITMEKSKSEKKLWKIKVTNTKKSLGRYYDVIILKTDSPIQPELKIRVFGNIIN